MLCQEDKLLIINYLKIFIILKVSAFDTILFDNGRAVNFSSVGTTEILTTGFNPLNVQRVETRC